jgi:hypothetical protein
VNNVATLRRPSATQLGYHNPPVFRRYDAWDKENPSFYPMFCRFAFRAIQSGKKRLSAALIFERIRWEMEIETQGGDDFKLNNNFRAIYARRFMFDYPNHDGLFEVRETPQTDLAVAA